MPHRTLSEFIAIALAKAFASTHAVSVEAHAKMGGVDAQETKGTADEGAASGSAPTTCGAILKRRDDFAFGAGTTGAAASTVDRQGDASKLEPKGSCLSIKPPNRLAAKN